MTYPDFTGKTITAAILGGQIPAAVHLEADRFKEVTGLQVDAAELPFADLYPRIMTELRAGTGGFDIVSVPQFYVGDMVSFLDPLDSYMQQYPFDAYEDILPSYRNLAVLNGKTYCITMDGDVWTLYYRLSAFADPKNQSDFKAKYGRDLAVPTTWDEYNQVAQFFTGGGKYGTAMMLAPVFAGNEFAQRFYSYGGKWFDAETMNAKVNTPAGVSAFQSIIETVKASPPGVLNYGQTEQNDDFAQGRIPMLIDWGDTGGHTGDPARAAKEVVGDVGYAPVPGAMLNGQLNRPQLLAWGFCLAVAKDSQNKDAAYQYIRFFTSREQGAAEVDLHKGLDPYRESYFASQGAQTQFPNSDKWLAQTLENQKNGVPDLRIPGAKQYYNLIAVGIGTALANNQNNLDAIDAQAVMDGIAKEMDRLTDDLGRDQQRQAYEGIMLADPSYSGMPDE